MFQVDLIEKCKKKDRKAQLKLYNQYCNAMFCVSVRFLKNKDDAMDVTQESFIKAFKKLDQYKGEVSFGAWLKRIVINNCIDFLKSKHQVHQSLDEGYLHISDDDDWTVEDRICIDEVKHAIESLPEKYKYVVMLYLIEGYDHSEISEILKIPETTSRTQLMKGKTQLKELLMQKQNGTRY